MNILRQNSRNLLLVALLLVVTLLQNCKKEAAHPAAALPKQGMYALINDTAWTAITVTASLEYNGSGTGKIFTCRGTGANQIIQLIAVQKSAAAGSDFPVGPANSSFASFGYYILPVHRNLTEQNPTAGTTAGTSLVITDIDTANRLISGTFKFPQQDTAYDAFGNVTAVQKNLIANGFFKHVHYVYTP
ncbi:MAG: hypothetical protein ACXVJN_14775 [Mucilaginibacter sp.]